MTTEDGVAELQQPTLPLPPHPPPAVPPLHLPHRPATTHPSYRARGVSTKQRPRTAALTRRQDEAAATHASSITRSLAYSSNPYYSTVIRPSSSAASHKYHSKINALAESKSSMKSTAATSAERIDSSHLSSAIISTTTMHQQSDQTNTLESIERQMQLAELQSRMAIDRSAALAALELERIQHTLVFDQLDAEYEEMCRHEEMWRLRSHVEDQLYRAHFPMNYLTAVQTPTMQQSSTAEADASTSLIVSPSHPQFHSPLPRPSLFRSSLPAIVSENSFGDSIRPRDLPFSNESDIAPNVLPSWQGVDFLLNPNLLPNEISPSIPLMSYIDLKVDLVPHSCALDFNDFDGRALRAISSVNMAISLDLGFDSLVNDYFDMSTIELPPIEPSDAVKAELQVSQKPENNPDFNLPKENVPKLKEKASKTASRTASRTASQAKIVKPGPTLTAPPPTTTAGSRISARREKSILTPYVPESETLSIQNPSSTTSSSSDLMRPLSLAVAADSLVSTRRNWVKRNVRELDEVNENKKAARRRNRKSYRERKEDENRDDQVKSGKEEGIDEPGSESDEEDESVEEGEDGEDDEDEEEEVEEEQEEEDVEEEANSLEVIAEESQSASSYFSSSSSSPSSSSLADSARSFSDEGSELNHDPEDSTAATSSIYSLQEFPGHSLDATTQQPSIVLHNPISTSSPHQSVRTKNRHRTIDSRASTHCSSTAVPRGPAIPLVSTIDFYHQHLNAGLDAAQDMLESLIKLIGRRIPSQSRPHSVIIQRGHEHKEEALNGQSILWIPINASFVAFDIQSRLLALWSSLSFSHDDMNQMIAKYSTPLHASQLIAALAQWEVCAAMWHERSALLGDSSWAVPRNHHGVEGIDLHSNVLIKTVQLMHACAALGVHHRDIALQAGQSMLTRMLNDCDYSCCRTAEHVASMLTRLDHSIEAHLTSPMKTMNLFEVKASHSFSSVVESSSSQRAHFVKPPRLQMHPRPTQAGEFMHLMRGSSVLSLPDHRCDVAILDAPSQKDEEKEETETSQQKYEHIKKDRPRTAIAQSVSRPTSAVKASSAASASSLSAAMAAKFHRANNRQWNLFT